MNKRLNCEMFFLARQSRGKALSEVAELVGVSVGYLSKIESDSTVPSEKRVESIAEHLRYPVSLFYRTEHVRGTDSICFHHRKQRTMPQTLLTQLESQMHLTQLQVASLLNDLEILSPNQMMTLDLEEYGNDPRLVAQTVRKLWHVPSGPIRDLVRLLESSGSIVVFRDFETNKLDGMSCWAKGCPPLFFINSLTPMDRARFTLAHELGHLVMHATPPAGDPEHEANEFASEFLMPTVEIKPDLLNMTMNKLVSLKHYWGTSMQAIVMAAQSMGVVGKTEVGKFYAQMSRRGWRVNEPYTPQREKAELLSRAIEARRVGMDYSVEELAKISDLRVDEFIELYLPDDDTPRLRLVSS
jgi:Zn-dependent peptidase ImmA (M78 family)/transcriptional regulator with XRE-family HTH domain